MSNKPDTADSASVTIENIKPYPELDSLFRRSSGGWIGADGAYSIPLSTTKTIWTFGDTWIGRIDGNRRSANCAMINNSAAIQSIAKGKRLHPLQFLWSPGDPPLSLWKSEEPKFYFWPGDGIALDEKLFVFLHKITAEKSKPEPFQFRTVSDCVVRIDNPLAPSAEWQMRYSDLGNDAEKLEYGTATICDDKHVYIYCSDRSRQDGLNAHPAILCRLSKDDFKNHHFNKIEYYKNNGAETNSIASRERDSDWVLNPKGSTIIFPDAAPEMSVTRVDGIPGFIAVYMPPLSKEIFIRHAMAPQGPWSDRIKIYDCPEKDDGILLYSAKAHQELAREPGELVVTYCRNSKDNKMHYKDASIYFPQAIRVKLKSK